MTTIVFFNGPPRAGKDTAGSVLFDRTTTVHIDKFARMLKESCHAAYGVRLRHKPAPHDYFESNKDTPQSVFFGKTPRQIYIAFSETYMKPTHGQDVFGKMLLEDLRYKSHRFIAITDSGFVKEADVLINHYGAANCVLVRLSRDGCDYSNDSRSHIALPGVSTFDIHNPGTSQADLEEALQPLWTRLSL